MLLSKLFIYCILKFFLNATVTSVGFYEQIKFYVILPTTTTTKKKEIVFFSKSGW